MSQCPRCGTPDLTVVVDERTGAAVEVRRPVTIRDRGGCLVIGLLVLGTVVAIPTVNWLGSLVGLHLWHWMTSPWPSPATMARTVLIFSLTLLLLVLAMRTMVNRRFSGPQQVCGVCGHVAQTAASRAGRGARIVLSIFLALIFACLGFCSLGIYPNQEESTPVVTPSPTR